MKQVEKIKNSRVTKYVLASMEVMLYMALIAIIWAASIRAILFLLGKL